MNFLSNKAEKKLYHAYCMSHCRYMVVNYGANIAQALWNHEMVVSGLQLGYRISMSLFCQSHNLVCYTSVVAETTKMWLSQKGTWKHGKIFF